MRERRNAGLCEVTLAAVELTPALSLAPTGAPIALHRAPIAIEFGNFRAGTEMSLLALDGDLNQPNAPECTMTGVFTVPTALELGRREGPSSTGPAGSRGGYGPERAAAEKRGRRTPSLVSLAQAKILCRSIAHHAPHHWRRV